MNLKEVDQGMAQHLNIDSESSNEIYGIVLKHRPKEIIGYISYEESSQDFNKVELTYIMSAKHWDKGYATEIAKCLILFQFENFQVSMIQSKRISDGSKTAKVLAKVNLVNESYLKKPSLRVGESGADDKGADWF